jgi:hypothetical protein
MKLYQKVLAVLFITFLLSLILTDRYVSITLSNLVFDGLHDVTITVDHNEQVYTKIGKSMLPWGDYHFKTPIGFQNIIIESNDFDIRREIKIFSLYRNYLDVEFSRDSENEITVIVRKSWCRLLYY